MFKSARSNFMYVAFALAGVFVLHDGPRTLPSHQLRSGFQRLLAEKKVKEVVVAGHSENVAN